MESLLILIGIFVVNAVIKGMAAKKKTSSPGRRPQTPSMQERPEESHQSGSGAQTLRDLVRQFEEAQREASQGTYVPPAPPVEEDDVFEDDIDLPVKKPANPGHFSFMEIAESVVQWEEVSIEYLQQAFGFSEKTATQVLAELQKHKIVGYDMGDGFCDVLVHDKVELANLFKREQHEAKKNQEKELARKKAELQNKRQASQNAINAELERQRQLNELENRAREARKNAGTGLPEAAALAALGENATIQHSPRLSAKNIDEIRRGFIWAKVLEEPRFKRHWKALSR